MVERPENYLAMNNLYHNLPAELRELRQWLLWRKELRGDKWTKIPYNPHTGYPASPTNPEQWGSFSEVLQVLSHKQGYYDGIGFVFTESDPYAGIDLDNKQDDPALQAQHDTILSAFPSYTELSPSGKGKHIIVKGAVPKGRNAGGVEIYSSGRFFTMTGNVIKNLPIIECEDLLLDLWRHYGGKNSVSTPKQIPAVQGVLIQCDQEILQLISQSQCAEKFERLSGGDSSVLTGSDHSPSAVDLSIVGMLSCFTRLPEQIERIWLSLPHGRREKTQTEAGYRQRTIRKALEEQFSLVEIIEPNGNTHSEPPQPLRRPMAPPKPFPLEALGNLLENAALAIVDRVQCPSALAALSVMGAASLAVQAHANVILPNINHAKPLSLFLMSIAKSGERKSAADREALAPVCEFEKELRAIYDAQITSYRNQMDAWEAERNTITRSKQLNYEAKAAALEALGAEPAPPLKPIITSPEPTFQGICLLYINGYPMLGIFSDEGAQFIGGHGMSTENKLLTAAGLSGLWDGSPIKRVRAGDGASVLPGRRLAMHLMVQPDVASTLLSDDVLKDQGFLSRILVSAPISTAGTRFQHQPSYNSRAALDLYHARILSILRQKPRLAVGKSNELDPRDLPLDHAAAAMWSQYADDIERKLGLNGEYEPISGFANKLPEHAARIAGVLTLVEDINAASIGTNMLSKGIILADYFASEALRLFDAGMVSQEIRKAELLLAWLHNSWSEDYISATVIYQRGPNSIREKQHANTAIAVLEHHGHLEAAPSGTLVNGVRVKKAWRIIRDGAARAAIPANQAA